MDVAAKLAVQAAAVQRLWTTDRRGYLATLSAIRCEAAAPLFGADLRRTVALERQVADVSRSAMRLVCFAFAANHQAATAGRGGHLCHDADTVCRCDLLVVLTQVHVIAAQPRRWLDVSDTLLDAVCTYARRAAIMEPEIREFMFVIPKVSISF